MAVRKTGISVMVLALGMSVRGERAPTPSASATSPDKAKGAAESGAKGKVEKEVNDKLLAEGRKNQCSFKTDSDQLMPGCDAEDQEAGGRAGRRQEAPPDGGREGLQVRGVRPHRLERQGRPQQGAVGQARGGDGQGAGRRAASRRARSSRSAWARSKPLVTPDNTPAKKAKNRRYEIQVRL